MYTLHVLSNSTRKWEHILHIYFFVPIKIIFGWLWLLFLFIYFFFHQYGLSLVICTHVANLFLSKILYNTNN
jgi:hypothetical protein